MIIQTDTRQQMKKKHHIDKENYFIAQGHKVIHSKCLVGDYIVPSDGKIAVDTKQHCNELYQDLISDHERFRNECILAQECGIKLYVVIENDCGFRQMDDIKNWKNPLYFAYLRDRKKGINRKPPVSNVQLLKVMWTMNKKYGVEFIFCPRNEAGAKVLELLGGDKE